MQKNIIVQNLKCSGCATTIVSKIQGLNGITNVQVDADNNTVSLELVNLKRLEIVEQTLVQLGYPPEGLANTFTSKTKSFISCATGK